MLDKQNTKLFKIKMKDSSMLNNHYIKNNFRYE